VTEAPQGNNRGNISVLGEQVALILSAIGTALTLALLLWYSRYGLDLTDESFYIVWISNPFIYSASVSQFGFIYHPLYRVLQGNIAALRQANILLTFCLAWLLTDTFLRTIFAVCQFNKWHRLAISAAFATLSLALFDSWLLTPSYNSLALQALLITATGLLLNEAGELRAGISNWVMIGIGGWLAFMAKPTTAAALAIGTAIYLLTAKKSGVRVLLASVATALVLLVASALLLDGSIMGFVARLKSGAELARSLTDNYSFSSLLALHHFQLTSLSDRAKVILLITTGAVFVCAYLLQSKSRPMLLGGSALLAIIVVFISLLLLGRTNGTSRQGRSLVVSIPFATVIMGVYLSRLKGLCQISRSKWLLAGLLLLFPHVYAFGTGRNYWDVGVAAGLFWVLSALVLLAPVAYNPKLLNILLCLGIATQSLAMVFLLIGLEGPERQPHTLRKNDYPMEIGRPGSTLILSSDHGRYIAESVATARRAEFKAGTPVIDLSGDSPGILYALGATNIGEAWMIGGYPGSNRLAIEALRKIPCEQLAEAWLLAEPDGPQSISNEVVTSFGADPAKDYEVAASWQTAEKTGGYEGRRLQQLLKPLRPTTKATGACNTTRTESR
jgi:hypothetical protein